MKVAKPDKQDFKGILDFMNAAEMALERQKFGITSSEDNWEEYLDEDDKDYKLIITMRKRIADEEGCDPENVDNRILMFEYLQRKFAASSSGWRRVYWAADILLDTCTDTYDHCLAWRPDAVLLHVANEF